MHRNAAATYASKNVRINCVMPGMIRTPASSEAHESSDVEAKTAAVSRRGFWDGSKVLGAPTHSKADTVVVRFPPSSQ